MNFQQERGADVNARPTAIFLEDQLKSIERHTAIAKSNGMNVVIARSVEVLDRELNSNHYGPILFLDMHMSGVIDLREVGHPEIKTDQGEAVAIALIRGYLPKKGLKGVPANILTGYPISPSANNQIERARAAGTNIDVVMKPELDKFEKMIKLHAATVNKHKSSMRNIIAAETVIGEWTGRDYSALGKIFNKPIQRRDDWQSAMAALGTDDLERVAQVADEILYIKESLVSLFGDDDVASSEFQWLNQPDRFLGNKSPWDLLTSGVEAERKKVVGLMGRLVG